MISLRGIRKTFGATHALRGVDLEVRPGEVHAIIGENGAGKSTLMKILSGALRPDAGELRLGGRPFAPATPHAAQLAGIGMVYQELNLAPHLSVRENLLLGIDPSLAGFSRVGEEKTMARAALERIGHADMDLERPVHRLSIAEQQVVEIARCCLRKVRLLILDEPTSSLGKGDIRQLFGFIRELRDAGVSILYISHFLEECREIADRYTVLRDGETVGSGEIAAVGTPELIRQMVGRDLGALYPPRQSRPGELVLRLQAVSGRRSPRDVSLELRAGEIVGVAGLIGAGRTELLRCIYGLDPRVAGTVEFGGEPLRPGRPDDALRRLIGLLSENRKEEGLLLNRSVTDNLLLTRMSRYRRGGLLSGVGLARRAQQWIERLNIKCSGPDTSAGGLSGGNQQKVALGRLLEHDARLLLLDEPTRGVDVGSKAQIYRTIAELAEQGRAILLVSSYLPELLGLCDRIAVMRRHRCVACRPRGEWTEESLLAAAIGGEWA
jgi:ribose transport system ATP-binding protein